jgi:hypothetical protein
MRPASFGRCEKNPGASPRCQCRVEAHQDGAPASSRPPVTSARRAACCARAGLGLARAQAGAVSGVRPTSPARGPPSQGAPSHCPPSQGPHRHRRTAAKRGGMGRADRWRRGKQPIWGLEDEPMTSNLPLPGAPSKRIVGSGRKREEHPLAECLTLTMDRATVRSPRRPYRHRPSVRDNTTPG